MNKRGITIIVIILVLLSNIVVAEPNDYNDYNNLVMDFNIETNFNMAGSPDLKVSEITSYLSFFPQNYNLQKVNSLDIYSTPKATTTQDTEKIEFKWTNPQESKFKFSINSKVTTTNALIPIDKKIQFPINEVSNSYTKGTEFIDITPEIRKQAEELATGEDDLYVVTFKLGSWVQKNIKYDLSTLTADVVQKSSWVLKNKEGVCDELTNLFISMTRSLGLQSRFVSGMVYSNIGNKWSPHAWAEVYFPDKGWIPFDVTYGQLGWIDPTHIKLKTNIDSGDPAIKYSWKSNGKTLEGKEIEIITKLIETGNKINSPLDFKVDSLVNNVKPGSYVPIEVEIKNLQDYYIPNQFVVIKGTNLTESNTKNILLKPGEIKKLFWITQVPEKIEDGYIYISTIEVEDQFHKKSSTNITYTKEGDQVTLREAQDMIEEAYQENKQKTISKKLSIKCDTSKTTLYKEETKVKCNLKNKGNTRLDNLNICYINECQKTSLSIAEEQEITISINNLNIGIQSINIEASNENTKASDIITIEVLENPGLKIVNINYPEKINYKDDFNMTLLISSKAPIKDINIKVNEKEIVDISELNSAEEILISAKGKDLLNKKTIDVKIEFKDLKDTPYTLENSYNIELINIPWYIDFLNAIGLI